LLEPETPVKTTRGVAWDVHVDILQVMLACSITRTSNLVFFRAANICRLDAEWLPFGVGDRICA
jgi:hypothetical protein